MASNMTAPTRPLNNTELVWRNTRIHIGKLYMSGKRDEALDLAWKCYQDPTIPYILRTQCCMILGTADGDYLRFAQEGVEFAESMVVCQTYHHVVSKTKLHRTLTRTTESCKQSSKKPKKCSTWLSKTARQITRRLSTPTLKLTLKLLLSPKLLVSRVHLPPTPTSRLREKLEVNNALPNE